MKQLLILFTILASICSSYAKAETYWENMEFTLDNFVEEEITTKINYKGIYGYLSQSDMHVRITLHCPEGKFPVAFSCDVERNSFLNFQSSLHNSYSLDCYYLKGDQYSNDQLHTLSVGIKCIDFN